MGKPVSQSFVPGRKLEKLLERAAQDPRTRPCHREKIAEELLKVKGRNVEGSDPYGFRHRRRW